MRKTLIALAIAGLLSACGTNYQAKRTELITSGSPPAYADGYIDGCQSGRAALGATTGERFTKNPVRFNQDSLYSQGWNDGFQVCQARLKQAYREWGV